MGIAWAELSEDWLPNEPWFIIKKTFFPMFDNLSNETILKCDSYLQRDLFSLILNAHSNQMSVRSHVGWRGERSIPYKGMGTSP